MNLWAPRYFVHNPGQFAQPYHFAIGKVADMRPAGKRKQVMLAHAVELDVPNQHDFIIILSENTLEMDARVGVQAGEYLRIHAGDPRGRFEQTLSVGVFSNGDQDFTHGVLDSLMIYGPLTFYGPLIFYGLIVIYGI